MLWFIWVSNHHAWQRSCYHSILYSCCWQGKSDNFCCILRTTYLHYTLHKMFSLLQVLKNVCLILFNNYLCSAVSFPSTKAQHSCFVSPCILEAHNYLVHAVLLKYEEWYSWEISTLWYPSSQEKVLKISIIT